MTTGGIFVYDCAHRNGHGFLTEEVNEGLNLACFLLTLVCLETEHHQPRKRDVQRKLLNELEAVLKACPSNFKTYHCNLISKACQQL